jgi:hypothetical protein
MADTTMTLKISSDISALSQGLASAQAALKAFGADVSALAGQSSAASAKMSADIGKSTDAQKDGAKQQQTAIEQINRTLASVDKVKPPKIQGPGSWPALLGIDRPQEQIDKVMNQARAAFERQVQQLQQDFEDAGGKGNLQSIVQAVVAAHQTGAQAMDVLTAGQRETSGDQPADQASSQNSSKQNAGGQANAAKLAQQFDQMVKLQNTFNAQMKQLSAQGSAAWKKDWESTVTPIGTALSGAFNKVLQGQATLGAAMRQAAQSIAMNFIQSSEKMVVKWVADRLAELTMTESTSTAQIASTTTAATTTAAVQSSAAQAGKAAQTAAGSSSVGASANQAAAGAYAAVSQIPYVGPVLAPAAAAAAFVAVMAYDVFSAEGGLERVPFDGMPAILHANETVMPASIANPMRDFFSNYDGPVANSNGGGDTHVHVNYAPNVSGKLSRSEFEGTLRDHAGVLARHVGNTVRNRA